MVIKLAVKNVVEFLYRNGNIDSGYGGVDRAQEGARIHRRLQKEAGEDYQSEVAFSHTTVLKAIEYHMEGRADGIIRKKEAVYVDEIKTTTLPYESITEENKGHLAQAKCYGHFLCQKESLPFVIIQMTYFQVETEQIKRFQTKYTKQELEQFFLGLLALYEKWAVFQLNFKTKRNESIKNMPFPFSDYRKGQRHMAVLTYRAIEKKERLFCQAPTGIGKTISTLFPSVKALAESKGEKIFYITAKTITRQAAEAAVYQMAQKGLQIKMSAITAKDKICFLEERNCTPQACVCAKGHYDRINEALYDIITSENIMKRDCIEKYAKKYHVCPFELGLDCTLFSDIIVCDYNYVFDPIVRLKRFLDKKGEHIFLIDEAHNLVDRARGMFSAQIEKKTLFGLKKIIPKEQKNLHKALKSVNQSFIALGKCCDEKGQLKQKNMPEELCAGLELFQKACGAFFEAHRNALISDEILPVYFEVLGYLKIAEMYDEKYVTFVIKSAGNIIVKLLCLDPSAHIDSVFQKTRAAILFSATFSPIEYFTDALAGRADDKKYALPSPFLRENMGLFVAEYINTKYYARQKSISEICALIHCVFMAKKGNYIVYFPSYEYMNETYGYFMEQYPHIKTILQSAYMKEEQKEEFLACFENENTALLAFCVMGGMYSEGIDLKGNRLIGTIIIGVGLPMFDTQQSILKEYYDKKTQKGYEFAYQYPGMNKVLQAAGRVIRSETDRGVVILADNRYTQPEYIRLFPPHWKGYHVMKNQNDMKRGLYDFWEYKK